MKITDKVLNTIKKYDMLDEGESVLVGLSGGADSVCLLLCLKELGFDVTAIHVNHNLRGEEADRDMHFCQELCQRLGIRLHVASIDVKGFCEREHLSTEEGARVLRYKEFKKLDISKVATAHNINDCLETTVFNLARGTGLKGLCSIPPKRGNIIRPLIEVTREEIEAYLSSVGQTFVTDSTNLSDDYTRNKIRHNVIPLLNALNSSLYSSYSNTREHLTSDNDCLEALAKKLLDSSKEETGVYKASGFISEHNAVSSRAVRMLLEENGIEVLALRITMTLDIIKNGGKYNICADKYVCCDKTTVRIISEPVKQKAFTANIAEFPYKCDFFGKTLEITELNGFKYKKGIHKTFDGHILDADKLCGNVTLRNRRNGDRIAIAGRGFTSKLKTLFNEKIPLEERDKTAILCDDNGIIYVEHFGVDERVKVDEETLRILIIKIS